jgi:hypothetical protein
MQKFATQNFRGQGLLGRGEGAFGRGREGDKNRGEGLLDSSR